jgi:hypothetical protein
MGLDMHAMGQDMPRHSKASLQSFAGKLSPLRCDYLPWAVTHIQKHKYSIMPFVA